MADINQRFFMLRQLLPSGEWTYKAAYGAHATPKLYGSAGVAKSSRPGYKSERWEVVEVEVKLVLPE